MTSKRPADDGGDRTTTTTNEEAFDLAIRAGELVSPETHDELRSWVNGDPMECPVCHEFAEEGDDCDEGHFDELGDAVLAALNNWDAVSAI